MKCSTMKNVFLLGTFFLLLFLCNINIEEKKMSRSRLSTSKMLVKLNIVGGNHKILFQTRTTHADEAHTTCTL